MRPLLIGQAPPPSYDPATHSPLYPVPEHATGGRLAALAGLSAHEYLATFQRINLLREFPGRRRHPCGTRRDHWPRAEARSAAEAIAPLLGDRTVVLLGRNVARAFGLEGAEFHVWRTVHVPYPPDQPVLFSAACVPHPSGLNRWYNDSRNLEAARAFWSELISLRRLHAFG